MFRHIRREIISIKNAILVLSVLTLVVSCSSSVNKIGSTTHALNVEEEQSLQPRGQVLSQGDVRVALLLPLSSPGSAGTATQFLNAAKMAIEEATIATQNNVGVSLIIKDTAGTPEGARKAAQEAAEENVELILGPLFSAEVAEAGKIAKRANIPLIGFSSDVTVAQSGVYLMSFLPNQQVQRIIGYAASEGRGSIAALLPSDNYGQRIEAALRTSAAQSGSRIMNISVYDNSKASRARAVKKVMAISTQIDAVFLPDDPRDARLLARQLRLAGLSPKKAIFLGSDRWDHSSTLQDPSLLGSWYPSAPHAGFYEFSKKYQTKYGAKPVRYATLSYDSVRIALALAARGGGERFSHAILANNDGFLGVDGVFRLRPDGKNERGLSVFEVTKNGITERTPAPTSF